eukprot:14353-Pelagococcus_subviridis.AAC.7
MRSPTVRPSFLSSLPFPADRRDPRLTRPFHPIHPSIDRSNQIESNHSKTNRDGPEDDGVAARRGHARETRRPRQLHPGVEVQPLGAQGRPAAMRVRPERPRGWALRRRAPRQSREGDGQAGRLADAAAEAVRGDAGGYARARDEKTQRGDHHVYVLGRVRGGAGREEDGPHAVVRDERERRAREEAEHGRRRGRRREDAVHSVHSAAVGAGDEVFRHGRAGDDVGDMGAELLRRVLHERMSGWS